MRRQEFAVVALATAFALAAPPAWAQRPGGTPAGTAEPRGGGGESGGGGGGSAVPRGGDSGGGSAGGSSGSSSSTSSSPSSSAPPSSYTPSAPSADPVSYAPQRRGGGNGGGNGGGGDGGSHGQSGVSHGSAKSQTASIDLDQSASSGKSGKSGKTLKVASEDKPGSLKSKLGGLNSLNRNINGLMNSSDPRMEAIRDFIKASASLATDTAALQKAQDALLAAQGDYDALVATLLPTAWDKSTDAYSDTSLAGLEQRLQDLTDLADKTTDPDDLVLINAEIKQLGTAIDAISTSDELAALNTATDDVSTLEQQVATDQTATDDDALKQALMAAANKNRITQYGDDYVDAAMLDWAKQKLGVGDYTGLIDAYTAQQ